MKFRTYLSEPVKENPHQIDVRQLYNDASAQIMHITLRPGEALKPHKTPVDVVFYVLEGRPEIHIGGEIQSFPVDTLIESPANIVHHIANPSDVPARIMVIKAPRPESATRLL